MDIKFILSIIGPLVTTLLAYILNKYFYNRACLIAYYGHIDSLKLNNPDDPEQPFRLNIHVIVLRNTGRVAAKNVRVIYQHFPDISFNISQGCNYTVSDIPDGGKEIMFPVLVPKEQINITYLYFPPKTFKDISTSIKSDEGLAREIHVIPAPSLSNWQTAILYFLLFVGCSTFIYWVGFLIIFF